MSVALNRLKIIIVARARRPLLQGEEKKNNGEEMV